MPQAYDYTDLDKLLDMVSGRAPASAPVQKEKKIMIEDTPIVEGDPGIQKFDVNATPLADAARKNSNMLIDENFKNQDQLAKQAQDAKAQYQDTRNKVGSKSDNLNSIAQSAYDNFQSKANTGTKMLLAQARHLNDPIDIPDPSSSYDAAAFQKALKDQLDAVSKSPTDVGDFDKMLAGLGPVLVGLAGGGQAGMNALNMSNAEIDRVRKQLLDDRKIKIENAGRQLMGTGRLLSAEAQMNRAKTERAKDIEDIKSKRIKDFADSLKNLTQDQRTILTDVLNKDTSLQTALLGSDERNASDSQKVSQDQNRETNKVVGEGIKGFVGAQQKDLDNQAAQKKAETMANGMLQRAKITAGAKKDDWNKFADDLDPNKARTGNFGKIQASINAADRIDAIFKQFPDYNIPKAQTHELATAAAALIGGGNPQSQKAIDDIVPNSVERSVKGLEAWLLNEPEGLNQKKFMQLMHDSALREREVALNQKRDVINSRIPKWNHLYNQDPEKYKLIIKGQGIDPSEIDERGLLKPRGQSPSKGSSNSGEGAKQVSFKPHPQDDVAVKWAKDHADDPRAKAILKANGM